MKKLLNASCALLTLATLTTACTQSPEPRTALTETQSEVSVAEATGAQKVPEASLHLKMAKDGVAQAQRLMNEKKYDEARAVHHRAQLDAKLATSLTREQEAKVKAQEQSDRLKSLNQSSSDESSTREPS